MEVFTLGITPYPDQQWMEQQARFSVVIPCLYERLELDTTSPRKFIQECQKTTPAIYTAAVHQKMGSQTASA
jgi:hypothetical protein